MTELKDKTVLILGMGVSGLAAASFLLKRGIKVKVSDSGDGTLKKSDVDKFKQSGECDFEWGGHTEEFCSGADIVVVSPGIDIKKSHSSGVLPKDVPVIGTLELGARYCEAPIIAITGTNGKSTVTDLIGHILSEAGMDVKVCGNIGNPLIGEVDGLSKNSIAVVEVSSFQLETIQRFKPYIAVLLNIAEDHYDRHGSYDGYKSEKYRIFENQTETDWAVINECLRDSPEIKDVRSRVVFFDKEMDEHVTAKKNEDTNSKLERKLPVFRHDEILPVSGDHNFENIACSIIVAGILGINTDKVKEAVKIFVPLRHRTERIGIINGIVFIDDSKATNIDATRVALETVDKQAVLIAGGRDKGGDYGSLVPLVKQKVKTIIVIREAKTRIVEAFEGETKVVDAEDMGDAVEKAIKYAEPGDIVMLSPMCSSFDMFSGYKERGEVFQSEVMKRAPKS